MTALSVSVVICTRDRPQHLKQALAGLARLDGPPVEVVIVHDPADAHTQAVISSWRHRVRSAWCEEPNLSKARNIGLSASSGDIIALLDDDAIPHPGWARRLQDRLQADEGLGAIGGYTVGWDGASFQARKILCDRYGDSHLVSDLMDERPLATKGSFVYPAPMGTNVALRRRALEQIRGFDEVFAYFLDETDVCLRLIEAGWRIAFEPTALVWHQFAESTLRDARRVPRDLIKLVTSKAYFVHRHGAAVGDVPGRLAALQNLDAFAQDRRAFVARVAAEGLIDTGTAHRLTCEIDKGLVQGEWNAITRLSQTNGDWTPGPRPSFQPFPARDAAHRTIGFICRSYPPRSENGIARWTQLSAESLAARGHTVHVIAEGAGAAAIRFRDGVWLHELEPAKAGYADIIARTGAPEHVAQWAAAVRDHLPVLQGFGVDVLSFPVWDVEGIGCFGQTDIPLIVSLHTTSVLSKATGPDGNALSSAPNTGLAQAEAFALARADHLIANSRAIITDIERTSGVAIADRTTVVAHGVAISPTAAAVGTAERLRVLFVGRHEPRKGAVHALEAVSRAIAGGADIEATFIGVGTDLLRHHPAWIAVEDATRLRTQGQLARDALTATYRSHDVLLVPSSYESFGLVAIEAMAEGLPVIAAAVGGLAEVVRHGDDGYLVAYDAALPDTMARHLIDLSSDRGLVSAMGARAYHRVQDEFSLTHMAAGLEAVYSAAAMARDT